MNGSSEARTFNNESITQSSTPAKFYRLPLPLDRIFVVDNSRSLRDCMRTLCAVCLSMIYRILAKNVKYYSYAGIQHFHSLSCIRPLAPEPIFLAGGGGGGGRG